jgi:hypothetical protein
MTLSELQQKIQRVRAILSNEMEREALRVGADIAAVVEDRVVRTGRDYQGRPFSPYSNRPVPAFFFAGRSRNAAGERRVQSAMKKRQGVSYRQFRQFNGLNTDKKNFEFTGEMWQGFGVKSVRQTRPGIFEVTIGGKNSRTESLLGYHEAREGVDITEPSQQELNQIQAAIQARIAKLIDNA